ncbi:MAG: phosphatase PAP2 family protein [Bacteroidales bacterium]
MKKIIFFLLLYSLNLCAQNIDINILKNINLNRNKNLDNSFRLITNSATPLSVGIPIVMFTDCLIAKDSVTKHNAIYICASVVFSMTIASIVKYSVNRPRPFVKYSFIEKETKGGGPSFPSGHSSDAFSLATSLSIAFPRWYVIIPSYLWAGAVGYSRMDLGVHYPSDVLAGAMIGAGSAFLCYKCQKWLMTKKRK